MASKMHLLCCSSPSRLLHSKGLSVGTSRSSSYYGSVVRCMKFVRRKVLSKGRICASYGEETSLGKLAVITLLAQSMVVSSAFADVELLNESQRMRLEMLKQIEKSLQQQQQQQQQQEEPVETQTPRLPVAPALEAPSLTQELPSSSPSPTPSASHSTLIEAPPAPNAETPVTIEDSSPSSPTPIAETPATIEEPSPSSPAPIAETPATIEEPSPSSPAPIAETPATIEEPSPSSPAPIAETPTVIEEPSVPPLSGNPDPNHVEVVPVTPSVPLPFEAPAQSTAAQSTDVEAGSNNVLGVIGVVGAALLGAFFLQKEQQPVANSPSDANATQSKEVERSSTSSKSVESNKLGDD